MLDIDVKFFTSLRAATAFTKFSHVPHKPKPPTIIEAPEKTSLVASSAEEYNLLKGFAELCFLRSAG